MRAGQVGQILEPRLRVAHTKIIVALSVAGALSIWTVPAARAETVLWKTEDLLKAYFPGADIVGKTYNLSATQREELAEKTRTKIKRSYTVFEARSDKRLEGYAIVDHEVGRIRPLTFGVKLSADGVVERVDLMVFREPLGHEVREPSFLKQFVGKGARDQVEVGTDIATPPARLPRGEAATRANALAVARGVRRVIVLLHGVVLADPLQK